MLLLVRWGLTAGAFWVVAHFVPGISIASWKTALILALVWGLLVFVVKPLLVLLTLPINLLTLGLFTLVINGFLFWLMAGFVKGFEVKGFVTALIGSLVLTVLMAIINLVLDRDED